MRREKQFALKSSSLQTDTHPWALCDITIGKNVTYFRFHYRSSAESSHQLVTFWTRYRRLGFLTPMLKPAPILKSGTTHLPVPCSLWHHHLPSPATQGQRLVPWMWLWLLGSRLGLWEGCKCRELRSPAVSGCPPDPRSDNTALCQHHESWLVCRRGCTVVISDIHVGHISNKLCWYTLLSGVPSAQYITHAAKHVL